MEKLKANSSTSPHEYGHAGNTDDIPGGPTHDKSEISLVANSGHSKFRKFRFSAALCAFFAGFTVIAPARDVYLEKFGADPILIGLLFILISFSNPVAEMVTGRLQQHDALSRLFPIEKWGRKAPWLWTHFIIMAFSTGCLLLPPSRDKFLLHGYFTIVSITMLWAMSTTLIAFEAARQELYPYNEERSEVEMFCKISCICGIGLGILPILVLLADSRFIVRAGASVFWCLTILVWGLQGNPIWKECKSTSKHEDSSLVQDLKIALSSFAFRHLCLSRFYDGAYQGIYAGMIFYFLTYILQLHGLERSMWLIFVGIASMCGEMTMAFYVQQLLRKRSFQFVLQSFVIKARMANCFCGAILLLLPVFLYGQDTLAKGSRELTITRIVFLVYAFMNRIFQAPFTFWRVGAQCWVIDEDIHESDGVRREAAFLSVFTASQNFARAFCAAGAFLGLGLTGLDLIDCESICEEAADCLGECAERNILKQPDSLRLYIRLCFVVGLSILEIAVIIHAALFPIRGIRLAKLYNNQTVAFGGKLKGVYSGPQKSKDCLNTVEMLNRALGESKMARPMDNVPSTIAELKAVQGRGRSSSGSFSVVWSPSKEANGVTDEEVSDETALPGTLRKHLDKHGHAVYTKTPVTADIRQSISSGESPAGEMHKDLINGFFKTNGTCDFEDLSADMKLTKRNKMSI